MKQPVVVTTEYRGVFFGYLESEEIIGEGEDLCVTVELKKARNCIYWDASVKGFLGLAANGPGDQCRIGPAADELKLYKVTSIAKATPKAAKNWEKAPWSA